MTDSVMKIVCPDCKQEINKPNEVGVGEILECQMCGTEVEITSLQPLTYREIIETK